MKTIRGPTKGAVEDSRVMISNIEEKVRMNGCGVDKERFFLQHARAIPPDNKNYLPASLIFGIFLFLCFSNFSN
jgi:hypothetical protein